MYCRGQIVLVCCLQWGFIYKLIVDGNNQQCWYGVEQQGGVLQLVKMFLWQQEIEVEDNEKVDG